MQPEGGHKRPALTLELLQPADAQLVTVQPLFLQNLSDHLGDHLTPADGFDTLLLDPLTAIDPEAATVPLLDASAAAAAFTAGQFAGSSLDPIAQDLATFTDNGDIIANGS